MIEANIIKQVLAREEGEQLEFKTTFQLDSIAKTICAFLNTKGGQIIIEADNFSKDEIKDFNALISELSSYLRTKISPESIFSVRIEAVGKKNIILVETLEGSKKPYVFNNTIFVRHHSKTIKAQPDDITNLIQDRRNTEVHWERLPVLDLEEEDLDIRTINNVIKTINENRNAEINDNSKFLSKFGLYINGNYTNASLILFGKEPAIYHPQCRVRLTVFNTDKTGSAFNYDKVLEGNLFNNVTDILQFFESSIGIYSKFDENLWQRTDTPHYPISALREGVLNAIIHRDYSNVSGSVNIGIYPEKIEISNYGELPNGITPADLKRNHLSIPRNPDIAHIFYLTQWIEKLGRGTLKIIEECRKAGLKEPKWVSNNGVTNLTIFGKQHLINQQVTKESLNERQMKLLQYLADKPTITASEYYDLLDENITERSARRDLSILVEGGWINKKGKSKNTVYVRTDKK